MPFCVVVSLFSDYCDRISQLVRQECDAKSISNCPYGVCTVDLKRLSCGGLATFKYVYEYELIFREGSPGIPSSNEQMRVVFVGV